MVLKGARLKESQSSAEGLQHPSFEDSDGRVVPKSVKPIEAVMWLPLAFHVAVLSASHQHSSVSC